MWDPFLTWVAKDTPATVLHLDFRPRANLVSKGFALATLGWAVPDASHVLPG